MIRGNRLRRLLGTILLLCIGTGVALISAEVLLRLFPGLLPPDRRAYLEAGDQSGGVPHPYIGSLHTPNQTWVLTSRDYSVKQTTDEHGFRNRGPWPERADIVVLGDSLAFGYGVADNGSWPAILDSSLPDLKVMNFGLVGAGPEQYMRVYRTFGSQLKPRLVIVGMFTGNDFWDTGMFNRWLRSGVKGNYMYWRDHGRGSAGVLGAAKRMIGAHSYVYNLALEARGRLLNRKKDRRTLTLKGGESVQLAIDEHEQLTAGSVAGSAELASVVGSLSALKAMAEAQDAQLLLVFQPSKEEVYSPMLGLRVRNSSEALRAELDRMKIRYIDLLPAFREHAKSGEKLYFEVDGHPNETGYRLIANSVIAYLKISRDSFGLPGSQVESRRRVNWDHRDQTRRFRGFSHERPYTR